jgi:hypothetical protein
MLETSRTSRTRSSRLVALSLLALGLVAQACATEPQVPVKIAPDGQVDIEGSRWKVLTSENGLDGRMIEIHRESNGHYIAKLIDKGRQLTGTVGAYPGAVVMDFVPAKGGVNLYQGLFVPIGGEAMDATFSVAANGQELKSNREDYPWVRTP